MVQYNPEVHTPQALGCQLQTIYEQYPEVLVTGSLGRAAVYGHLFNEAEYEYRLTDRLPTQMWSGAAAAIDVIGMPGGEREANGLFEVDTLTFGGKQVTIRNDGMNWLLESPNRKYKVALFPQIMEPLIAKTVYGADCRTLHPQTHLALIGLSGTFRPQDIQAYERLSSAIALGDVDLLPVPMFAPFEELRELNSKSGFTQVRKIYRSTIPFSLRRKVSPLTQVVKDRMLR